MIVQELIDKLNKLPKDADVVVVNSESFDDGVYMATNVSHFDNSNIVVIGTDYTEKLDEEEDMSKKQDEIIDIQNLIIDKQSDMITYLMDKSVKQEKLIDKQSELIEVQQKIIGQKDKQIKLMEVFCNE